MGVGQMSHSGRRDVSAWGTGCGYHQALLLLSVSAFDRTVVAEPSGDEASMYL
jgi:hypothetical protein